MKYYYDTTKEPHKIEWRNEIECAFDKDDLESIAEECAEDYHDNCDGWESRWPIVFHIWDSDDNYLGCKNVERDYSPNFSAYEVSK